MAQTPIYKFELPADTTPISQTAAIMRSQGNAAEAGFTQIKTDVTNAATAATAASASAAAASATAANTSKTAAATSATAAATSATGAATSKTGADTAKAAAQSAQTAAEAARDAAKAVGNTNDTITKGLLDDPASATSIKLAASYAPRSTPWTLLPMTNGWSAFGSTYTPPQYRLVGDRVELNGLAKGTQGVPMATLPAGLTAPGVMMHPTVGAVGGVKGFYAVDTTPTGTLTVAGSSVMNYVSLTGISFPVNAIPPA